MLTSNSPRCNLILGINVGEITNMCLFDVILPTLDVYGDASLIIPWLYRGHYKYAGLMTIPMILNYTFTVYKWWTIEKPSNRKWSWVLVVLQLWQQWRALKIIYMFYKKNKCAEEKKKLEELAEAEKAKASLKKKQEEEKKKKLEELAQQQK